MCTKWGQLFQVMENIAFFWPYECQNLERMVEKNTWYFYALFKRFKKKERNAFNLACCFFGKNKEKMPCGLLIMMVSKISNTGLCSNYWSLAFLIFIDYMGCPCLLYFLSAQSKIWYNIIYTSHLCGHWNELLNRIKSSFFSRLHKPTCQMHSLIKLRTFYSSLH